MPYFYPSGLSRLFLSYSVSRTTPSRASMPEQKPNHGITIWKNLIILFYRTRIQHEPLYQSQLALQVPSASPYLVFARMPFGGSPILRVKLGLFWSSWWRSRRAGSVCKSGSYLTPPGSLALDFFRMGITIPQPPSMIPPSPPKPNNPINTYIVLPAPPRSTPPIDSLCSLFDSNFSPNFLLQKPLKQHGVTLSMKCCVLE